MKETSVQENLMNAIQGLEMIAAGIENSKESLGYLENATIAVFNAMIANSVTAFQAMKSLGGVLDAIAAKHKEKKTEASTAMKALLEIRKEKIFYRG